MDVNDIVKTWFKENGFDGLCNEDCGCSLDDFVPCGGPNGDCEPALMCILSADEYLGNCGPGDIWFYPAGSKGMKKCWSCGEEVDPKEANGIYGKYGHRWYCKKPECQERFIEDAGDPPDPPDPREDR